MSRSRGGRRGNALQGYNYDESNSFSREQGNFPQQHRKILGENTYRILIRESKVKVVLGPEGRHIKEIKSKCKEASKITIYTQHADGEPFPPNCPDRILNLDCSFDDLELILTDLIPHLQIAPPDLMTHKYNEIRLVVPEFVCSMIIGKAGVNVKNIQKDLKSFVQVHKDPLPYSTEYVVSLTNKDINALASSVTRIFDTINSIKSISNVTMYNPVVWFPGDFGDTGSFTEESHGRSHYNSTHQEPRFYREEPRYHDDDPYQQSGYVGNGSPRCSSENHASNRQYSNNRSMRGSGRGRNYHRGSRQQNVNRDTYRHHRSDDQGYNRNVSNTITHAGNDRVIPRRPHGIRGRAVNGN